MGNENSLEAGSGDAGGASAALVLNDSPMPAAAEVDSLFEAWMEEKSMKAAARAAMRQLPGDKKWLVLQQEKAKAASESRHRAVSNTESPEFWVQVLNGQSVTADQLRTFRVVMSAQVLRGCDLPRVSHKVVVIVQF
jgi:hypothetical protein